MKRKRRLTKLGAFLVGIIAVLAVALIASLGFLGYKMLQPTEPKTEIKEEVKNEEKETEPVLNDREQAYAKAHPDLSIEEVQKQVWMNLDQEAYTHMQPVEDLDSMLQLVNKYYYLPSDYEPSDLISVSSSGENGTVYMRKEAADAFEKLVQASYKQGFILNACSAYRSYEYQENLYNNGVTNYGQEYADAYWTRPGSSEHQTGLSVDIRMDNDTSDLDAVRNHPSYSWLLEHMHEYGFILRYPDDKENYTLIAPESWHLRYVGVDAATKIHENQWCLEEYLYYVQ
ncbi:M15 family metallopeptidase [Faecalicoccus pleomorphus]|uniref:M15 family metallopeptidase n=1 Tax=Faecalicoccus pleomorphus TaxID=1323 RepID=UPI00189C3EF9|nr:M15 family metallopeptidase [Faecalicoccus pleomorphus]MDB7984411.1 M15 family metallopeptidase [Faecalicoccus pleomorphus]